MIWGLQEQHSVELGPLDVCSVPADTPRRFISLSGGADGETGHLLAVQPREAPNVEFV